MRSIVRGNFKVSPRFSPEVNGLICWLMEYNPSDRPDFDQIASHAWMRKMEGLEGDYYNVERKSYMGGKNPYADEDFGYRGNQYMSPNMYRNYKTLGMKLISMLKIGIRLIRI